MMSRLAIILASASLSCLLTGCVLGSDKAPGCRVDHPGDCAEGWSCKAGLCVRPTTGLTQPEAGTQGDAAIDSQSDTATDSPSDAVAELWADGQAEDAVADGQAEDAVADGPIEAEDGASEASD